MKIVDVIGMIDFTEEEYNEKVLGQDGVATFEEFIGGIIDITKDNHGTIEDAVFIANDAFRQL